MALFLGTFTYALTVLRTIRTAADDQRLFVPQMAVTVAYLLTVASVLGLVLFLAHLAKEIRAETMLANVHRDAADTLSRVLSAPDNPGDGACELPEPPDPAPSLTAGYSGFLVRVDEQALLAAAVQADAILVIDRPTGSSVVANTPIGVSWPLPGRSFDDDALKRSVRMSSEPSAPAGSGRPRATSGSACGSLPMSRSRRCRPASLTPRQRLHAIGHSSSLLCELSQRDLGPRLLRDESGTIRVVLHRASFGDLLELAVAQPRRFGATDPDVLSRLFQLLHEIAWIAPQVVQHHAVAGQLVRLQATTADQDFLPTERAHLKALGHRVEQTLSRQRGPSDTASAHSLEWE